MVGVVVHPAEHGIDGWQSILGDGRVLQHSARDIVFCERDWAFSRVVTADLRVAESADLNAPGLAPALRLLASSSPQIANHVHASVARFASIVDQHKLPRIDAKASQVYAHFTALNSSTVSADDVAAFIFLGTGTVEGNVSGSVGSSGTPSPMTKPTPSESFAAFVHMCANSQYYDPVDIASIRHTRSFRLRSVFESKNIDYLQRVLAAKKSPLDFPQGARDFNSFLEKCRRLILSARATVVSSSEDTVDGATVYDELGSGRPTTGESTTRTRSNQVPSFTNDNLASGKDFSYAIPDVKWTPSDAAFIFAAVRALVGSLHLPNPYRSFFMTGVLKSSLSDLFPYPVDKRPVQLQDIHRFLREISVFSPFEDSSWVHAVQGEMGRNHIAKYEGLFQSLTVWSTANGLKDWQAYMDLLKSCLTSASSLVDDFKSGRVALNKSGLAAPARPSPSRNIASAEISKETDKTLRRTLAQFSSFPLPKNELTNRFHAQDPHAHLRSDFGNHPVYIIDDPSAKELDDGVSMEGDWIHVHIADPTALIPHNHILGTVAALRGNSAYTAARHWSMMPENLSKNLFNLDVSPCAMTFSAKIGEHGDIIDYRVHPSYIKNVKKVFYDDVDKVLDWKKLHHFNEWQQKDTQVSPWVNSTYDYKLTTPTASPLIPDDDKIRLCKMQGLLQKHHAFRVRSGAIGNDKPEYDISLEPYPISLRPPISGEGFASFVETKDRFPTISLNPHAAAHLSPSRNMVAEAMLIAGRIASKFCQDRQIPILYRSQESAIEAFRGQTLDIQAQDGEGVGPTASLEATSSLSTIEKMLNEMNVVKNERTGVLSFQNWNKLLNSQSVPRAKLRSKPFKHSAIGLPGIEDVVKGSQTIRSPGMLVTDMDVLNDSQSPFFGYTRVTSPLRRYVDLITHWQIKAFMAKSKPARFGSKISSSGQEATVYPFTETELHQLKPHLADSERFSRIMSVRSTRFWALEWIRRKEILSRRGVDTSDMKCEPIGHSIGKYHDTIDFRVGGPTYTGYVSQVDETSNSRSVMILDFGGVTGRIVGTSADQAKARVGSVVKVQIERVIPDSATLFLREVGLNI